MGNDKPKTPLIHENVLIILGGITIMGFTIYGIMNDPGLLIKQDLLMGPVIATARIVVPLFLTIFVLSLIARFRKCPDCGKIFFRKNAQDCT